MSQENSQYFIERLCLRIIIKDHLLFSLKDCISPTANLKRPPVSKIHNKAIQQNMSYTFSTATICVTKENLTFHASSEDATESRLLLGAVSLYKVKCRERQKVNLEDQ